MKSNKVASVFGFLQKLVFLLVLIFISTQTAFAIGDITPPVITINGLGTIDINVGTGYTDAGATAIDDTDGVIVLNNSNISNSVNTNVTGTYYVIYTVSDVAGNTSQVIRFVNVNSIPVTPPVITITGADPMDITVGSPYIEYGATAVDSIDGTIVVDSSNISGGVLTSAVGTYYIFYTVTNSSGKSAQVHRTVNVTSVPVVPDTVAPIITINGLNPETITLGAVYTDAGATAFDIVDGTTTVNSTSTLDINIIGSYTVTYTSQDIAGNIASTTRVVNVVALPVPNLGGGVAIIPIISTSTTNSNSTSTASSTEVASSTALSDISTSTTTSTQDVLAVSTSSSTLVENIVDNTDGNIPPSNSKTIQTPSVLLSDAENNSATTSDFSTTTNPNLAAAIFSGFDGGSMWYILILIILAYIIYRIYKNREENK